MHVHGAGVVWQSGIDHQYMLMLTQVPSTRFFSILPAGPRIIFIYSNTANTQVQSTTHRFFSSFNYWTSYFFFIFSCFFHTIWYVGHCLVSYPSVQQATGNCWFLMMTHSVHFLCRKDLTFSQMCIFYAKDLTLAQTCIFYVEKNWVFTSDALLLLLLLLVFHHWMVPGPSWPLFSTHSFILYG